jgi:60S ribosome subunit biogenesis protein NIP7
LSIIAPHARYKVWVKQNGEMPFLYGGNVLKAHVGRWSEDCPEHAGVLVLSMNDTPLVSLHLYLNALGGERVKDG